MLSDEELVEIFAEDLFQFVLNETVAPQRCSRNLEERQNTSSPFTSSVRFAVRFYLEKDEVATRNIFNSIVSHGDLRTQFRYLASTMAELYFMRGYTEKEFVQFCSTICKLGVLCCVNNYREGMLCAIQSIVDAIGFFKGAGEFDALSWSKLSREVLFM